LWGVGLLRGGKGREGTLVAKIMGKSLLKKFLSKNGGKKQPVVLRGCLPGGGTVHCTKAGTTRVQQKSKTEILLQGGGKENKKKERHQNPIKWKGFPGGNTLWWSDWIRTGEHAF